MTRLVIAKLVGLLGILGLVALLAQKGFRILEDASANMAQLQSVSGNSVAEAYYHEVGNALQGMQWLVLAGLLLLGGSLVVNVLRLVVKDGKG